MSHQIVGTVIREVDDDRRVGQTVRFQPLKDASDDSVVLAGRVKMLGDDFTVQIRLGIVAGNGDFGSVGFVFELGSI